ncbi:hypothetical protein Acr_19g0005780 [Actinidia rufa]|uniref:CCHC-type domain-containing protein n=1 Tax=Actinidia rufa TaxID=165716 RepID=A0A7J0GA66_9ERIC|nr:hypothetical protein Acr_19g0005780 [Actinidia rufa]
MANTREGSINEEATGETITRGEFRQFQQETQQILRDLQQAIAALLPREPYHGVAGLHQECQERDHRGYDRGPVHPHRPQSMRMRAVKMKPMPMKFLVVGVIKEVVVRGVVTKENHDQGGRMVGNFESRDYRMKMDLPSFNGNLQIEGFLDWIIEVERFFEYMEIPEEKQVKLGVRTSEAYTEEFYRLSARATNLPESEDQQIARFVNGLRVAIRDQSQPVTNSGSQTKAVTTGSTTRQGGNPNPYAKVSGDKCYRCGEPGHRSNTCPKRATVNLVEPVPEEEDGGDDEGDVDPYSYDPNEFQDDEEGEYLGRSLVIQKLLLTPKRVDSSQRPQESFEDGVPSTSGNDKKVVLSPLKESSVPKVPKEEGKSSVLLVYNEDEVRQRLEASNAKYKDTVAK